MTKFERLMIVSLLALPLVNGTYSPACADEQSLKEQMRAAIRQELNNKRTLLEQKNVQPQKYSSGYPVHDAVINKDMDSLLALIKQGADVNAINDHKETPLHYAARGMNFDFVKALVDRGANVDAQNFEGGTPLFLLIGQQYTYPSDSKLLPTVHFLVEKGAAVNATDLYDNSILEMAYKSRLMDVVYYLLLHGASPNVKASKPEHKSILNMVADASPEQFKTNFSTAIDRPASGSTLPEEFKNQVSFAALLLDKGANINSLSNSPYPPEAPVSIGMFTATPLLSAVNNKNKALVDLFISRGASLDLQDSYGHHLLNPLDVAIMQNDLEMVKYLLSKGIKPSTSASAPISSLILAIGVNNIEIIDFLIQQGADINEKGPQSSGGDTPILYAIREKWRAAPTTLPTIKSLVEHGANINARNSISGETPLHVAASNHCDLEIVKYLIDKGADLKAVRTDGYGTPLQTACRYKNNNVVQLLVQNSAETSDRGNPCASFAKPAQSISIMPSASRENSVVPLRTEQLLPNPSGTPARGNNALKKIRFQTIKEMHKTSGNTQSVWIAGQGSVIFNAGQSFFCAPNATAEPANLELTFAGISENELTDCLKLLDTKTPLLKPVDIIGTGDFTSKNVGKNSGPLGPFLGVVQLTSLQSCRLADNVGSDPRLSQW